MQDVEKEMPDLVQILLGSDSAARRKVVNRYFDEKAVFEHPFFVLTNREQIFWMYEFWADVNRPHRVYAKLEDWVVSGAKGLSIVWCPVRPYLGLPLLPTLHIKISTKLDFRDTAAGKIITKQVDSHYWLTSILHSTPVLRTVWKYAFEMGYRRVYGVFITAATKQLHQTLQKLLRFGSEELPKDRPVNHAEGINTTVARHAPH